MIVAWHVFSLCNAGYVKQLLLHPLTCSSHSHYFAFFASWWQCFVNLCELTFVHHLGHMDLCMVDNDFG